jgi:hypothetical protein
MRYIEPLIGFLAFLWLLTASVVADRSLREWQHKAEALLGLSGMALFGLILYEAVYVGEVRHPRVFIWCKALLGGISIGIFVTLWMEGSLNVFKKARQR